MADLLSVGKPVGDEFPVKFPADEGRARYFFRGIFRLGAGCSIAGHSKA